ncbi:RmlC-like cupin [Pleomassaria siparia CBS 279.74]|uniref:RmlC-like cupin n=1 Tax=Pleomassaria siparia CBS 279.74 TaxID=1314801 RepID=A0A6G1KFK6_9PLEO|nr:RmlC-like cupin [Pleomassaria siparia CBS 279.74]
MTIMNVLVTILATSSAIQALPQPAWVWNTPPSDPYDASYEANGPGVEAAAVTSPAAAAAAATATATATAPSPSTSTAAAAAPAPPTPNIAAVDTLAADLIKAPTTIKRFQRLLTSQDAKGYGGALLAPDVIKPLIAFDFNAATPAPNSKGGKILAANIDNFPILTGLGISTTVGFLGPCGMNSPHVHPRATEFLTVVEGNVNFGLILENGFVRSGSPEVAARIGKFQGTVFPMGSIHYQINEDCAPATFVATLNSEDPGTSTIAQNFFALNGEVVEATLGFPQTLNGKDIESFRKDIPANIALSIDECLKKCNIDPNAAPK